MKNEKIVLIARLKVKVDKIEELKSAALKIVADSRAEDGNVNYDIHQSVEDETLFFWHETWANKAALDEHFATPFFQEFFGVVEQIAAEPPQINLTRMISEKTNETNRRKILMKKPNFIYQPMLLITLFLLIFTGQGCNQAATQTKPEGKKSPAKRKRKHQNILICVLKSKSCSATRTPLRSAMI